MKHSLTDIARSGRIDALARLAPTRRSGRNPHRFVPLTDNGVSLVFIRESETGRGGSSAVAERPAKRRTASPFGSSKNRSSARNTSLFGRVAPKPIS